MIMPPVPPRRARPALVRSPVLAPADRLAAPGLRSGEQPRILVVEDDYFAGLACEAALAEAGYAVTAVATSGEEALAIAEADPPALVVMDIRLAGAMDGIAAATALRARGIPSVFATAHTDPGTLARAEVARPLGWVGKPYSDGDLVAAVRAALAARDGGDAPH
jgi:CheY-like chemotaxis protein